jgi:hypothetical protein
MTGKHFAAIPLEVLTSDACRTLPAYAVRVLLAIAAQYRGRNNGDLALTYATARPFGVVSKKQLVASLAALLDRGLIQKTRQGGKKPLGPSLYAISWQCVDDLMGKIESGATTAPSNLWAQWSDPPLSAPQGDQSAENHQHHRGTSSAPQGDQTGAKSAPRGDQKPHFIGTTGGAPSRSWSEGHSLVVLNGAEGAHTAIGHAGSPAPQPVADFAPHPPLSASHG